MLRDSDVAPREDDTALPRPQPPASSSGERIPTVTASTFNSVVLQGGGPIAVEFMTYGCAHCRVIEPILQAVAEALHGKEALFKVNTAVDGVLADTFEVRGTPTFVMFLDGKEVGRADGPHPNFASVLSAVTQPFE